MLQQAAWCVFMAVAFGAVAVPYVGHAFRAMHCLLIRCYQQRGALAQRPEMPVAAAAAAQVL